MAKLKPPPIADYMDQLFPSQQGERDLEGLKIVEIDRVKPRVNQPRRFFDRARLTELATDIRKTREDGGGIGGTGILQPLLVTLATDGRGYILTAGERRWRAAMEAENREVPVLIRDQSSEDAYEDALRENIQREDLTVIEEAEALRHIMDARKLSLRQAAERFGKDKGWLENRLRLLKSGADVQEMVSLRKDTLSHAYIIDGVKDQKLRRQLIKAVIDDFASVASIRRRVEEANRPARATVAAPAEVPEADVPVAVPTVGTTIETRTEEITFVRERLPQGGVHPVLRPAIDHAAEVVRLLEEGQATGDYKPVLRDELVQLEKFLTRIRDLTR